jgi:deoxyhypusine monooxygenase
METCTSLPAFEASESTQQFLADKLVDQTLPISERFRALFSLRNLTGSIPREALISATNDPSNLLAHEAAFALGQMQDAEAVPALQAILLDYSRHPIVRHEAAEALGAICLDDNIPFLKNCLKKDPAQEVRETCELALRRLEERKHRSADKESSIAERSPFFSVDPAAPASSESRVEELRKVLLDEEKGMYERYAALFALRNRGGAEAVDAVVAALQAQSALLRHEVAYVLGQLQDKVSSVALSETLRDANEHPMVRHEAAEALGSIADSESITLLKQYEKDTEPIVSQSCEVALSMLEFEQSGKSFEYLLFQSPEVH